MKVLNYTTSYLAVMLLILISIWAGIFYYAMLDEIYDSIDDGLDNQKGLIIQKATQDSSILRKQHFEEGDYAIREISAGQATHHHDISLDTLMYMQNEQDYEPVRMLRTVFHLNGRYYQMEVITSMVEEDDLIAELFYALLWLYGGLVITILILNNYLLRRVWRPFYHLLRQIRGFKLEKPAPIEVRPTSIDEFRLLNESVQKLLKSNIEAYNSQKQLIENASHELQTPLANSINQLEALAEKSTMNEDELRLLGAALDNLGRLTRLNKSLLLLSRIENRQFIQEDAVVINELVHKICNEFGDQLQYHRITLQIKEEGKLLATMNADLAMILLTNLIKNAVIHNRESGGILITITTSQVRVENTGSHTALNEERLFTRFNQDRPSEQSTGLGLAIVKAICNRYNFRIAYSFPGNHIFTVFFS